MTSIKLLNPQTQEQKEVPVGFSWTYFFFGFMVPLLRGDWKWAIISFIPWAIFFASGFLQNIPLLLSIVIGILDFGYLLAWIIFAFFYNKLYVKSLIEEGFQALDAEGKQYLNQLSA